MWMLFLLEDACDDRKLLLFASSLKRGKAIHSIPIVGVAATVGRGADDRVFQADSEWTPPCAPAHARAREKSLKNFRQVPRLIAITAKGISARSHD
jgi:hypothetical protein